jgi:hypothetical protein
MDVLSSNLTPCYHDSFPYITGFDIEISCQDFKPHARMHHVVIIVIIVMLTICYSMMSHAIPILVCHTFMLTLQKNSCALWLPQV